MKTTIAIKTLVLSLSPQKYNPASASFSGDGFSCGQLLKVSKQDGKFLKSEQTGESQLKSSVQNVKETHNLQNGQGADEF